MSQMLRFKISEIMPERAPVLKSQGIPEGKAAPEKIVSLLEKAIETASTSLWPVGMISEVKKKEFGPIFKGEGQNEPETPLELIFPKADRLALFAVTLGSKISLEIEELFKSSDFALGTMLDAVASQAADKAVEVMEARLKEEMIKQRKEQSEGGDAPEGIHVLSYSPGYCGWHVSGQKKLFEYLKPEEIGISLNESFLMIPLKSVTGVLIAGAREIHLFEAKYPFCKLCKHPTCLDRRKNILKAGENK